MNRGEIMLEVKNLVKKFGDLEVLKNISFTMEEGEVLSIIGPSGAGKSTIIRSLNKLEDIDGGDIKLAGDYLFENGRSKPVDNLAKKIGLVFQNYNLFPHMSVLENITASLINVYGIDKVKAVEMAKEELDKVKLLEKKDKYPFQLSGGEKQRVAVARACVLEPKIICLDEPTSALDPESRTYIESLVLDLKSRGMSVLIISHDMKFARNVSNRIIFLEKGEIIAELGRSDFSNIENVRLANFVNA